MSPGCDARCLVWPEWIAPADGAGIADCQLDAGHDEMHQGEIPRFGTLVSWAEGDRRTFRGEAAYCSATDGGRRCVLPDDHRGRHAF